MNKRELFLIISIGFIAELNSVCDDEFNQSLLNFPAEEARQGVAVDEKYVYAIGTTSIGKYDKSSGREMAHWESYKETPLIHLDSGVVVNDRLYCSHSNYPSLPMISSVEIWDVKTLEHIESLSFGISEGSCTWIDRYDDYWWVMYAHYNHQGGYTDKGNEWTTLVQYNDQWQRMQAWVFPQRILKRFGRYSCSGGSWGPDGFLYCTGHDLSELYVFSLPKSGSILKLEKILPFINEGQGIAFDRFRRGVLYGIVKRNHQVIAANIFDE